MGRRCAAAPVGMLQAAVDCHRLSVRSDMVRPFVVARVLRFVCEQQIDKLNRLKVFY